MDQAISREQFEHEGRAFEMALFNDDDSSPPWENSDCHGPVRFISDSEPLESGECILYDCQRGRYVYGLRDAIRQSIRDRWGVSKETRAEVARAMRKKPREVSPVDADRHYLRGYCADEWNYVGVSVRIIGADGEPIGDDYIHAIWCIESNAGEYLYETACELAGQILSERRGKWRAALAEARKARYWASRDVQTVGA